MRVVVVGGVAGGATAAARIRRLDEQAEIIVFERSGYVSYANCGLPYYIGGVITDPDALTLQTPESFWERLEEIPREKPVYVMCQSGLRSYIACRILSGNGYDCYNFSGGYGFYQSVVLDEQAAAETLPCGMEREGVQVASAETRESL